MDKKLAVITGASSGIGYELAILCARDGYDLVVAADAAEIRVAAEYFRTLGVSVEAIEADLATREGVDTVVQAVADREVDLLLANAGHGLGQAFLSQNFEEIRHVIDTNVTGTLYLIHTLGGRMKARGEGRILITGSIAGYIPGAFHAVYNASKAFIDSFAAALRAELKDSGVTVTCLMPGPTDTDFFERAELGETRLAQGRKDDPAEVARVGYDAMMQGEPDVVSGWRNKLQASLANLIPSSVLAEQHRRLAETGTDEG
jgi:short-subunit dehydrogenase